MSTLLKVGKWALKSNMEPYSNAAQILLKPGSLNTGEDELLRDMRNPLSGRNLLDPIATGLKMGSGQKMRDLLSPNATRASTNGQKGNPNHDDAGRFC